MSGLNSQIRVQTEVSHMDKDEIDQAILSITQDGIPLEKEPFEEIAKQVGISREEVITRLKRLRSIGIIKRLGVSVNQRKVGIVANAVVAWKVPEEQLEHVGTLLSSYTEVTHCYGRVTIPGKWEHNLFTVVHGYSRESVEAVAKNLSEACGISDYLVMFSNGQYKRTSVKHPF